MQSVNRGGEVELFLQTTPRCRARIQAFKHGSASGWTVHECGRTDDANKAVIGFASIYNRWRSAADSDSEFDLPRQLARDAACPFADLLDALQRIIVAAGDDCRGRGIRLERVFGHDAEETWPAASNRPQQIRILLVAREDQTAVGGYHSCRLNAEAGWSPIVEVPADPAVEKESAPRHGRAVAHREGKALGVEHTIQLTARNRGLNYRATSLAVNRDLVETTKIDQKAVVTE